MCLNGTEHSTFHCLLTGRYFCRGRMGMHIEIIDSVERFRDLRDAWERVSAADPDATVFLSHQWLGEWLSASPGVWFVLAVERTPQSGDYCAFAPLRLCAKFDKQAGLYNELYMAGGSYADYTGLLCMPDAEKEAVPALAAHIRRKLDWAVFRMDSLLMSERRRKLFFKAFDRRQFHHEEIGYVEPGTGIDNGVSPIADLPENWEDYLGGLSANARQKIRRLLRKLEGDAACRISVLEGDEMTAGIDTLLDLWLSKWSPIKGANRAEEIADRNRVMLRRCAGNGTLFMPAFWQRDRQVALLGTLIDPVKRSMNFFITGRDESYTDLPAGYLLHAFSIRHAIANGFRTYDFLRGTEPYKYHFANREARMSACALKTLDGRNLHGALDPRCLDGMVEMAKRFDDGGEGEDAETAYRQILAASPDDPLLLYRMGRLFARRGEHSAALPWLRRSLELEPEGDNAWMWLARSQQAIGDTNAALGAWGKLLALRPADQEARQASARLRIAALQPQHATAAAAPFLSVPQGMFLRP